MTLQVTSGGRERGQMIVLFALALTAIILMVGLVVDGGNALAQRRAAQNAADFAALAGARIVALHVSGDNTNGTDENVQNAISHSIAINGGTPVHYGAPANPGDPEGPRYVDKGGVLLNYVGVGPIPVEAVGVKVGSSRSWNPFFLGLAGINNWTASATATAKGGWAAGGPGGDVLPIGVAEKFFETYPFCTGEVGVDPNCDPQRLTAGSLNVSGGFGWLAFGAVDKCKGYGLGMSTTEGCDYSDKFLEEELGPPPNSFGCCDAVQGGPSTDKNPIDRIGNMTGNKVAQNDCSYYIDKKVVVTVPVWDNAGGSGANAYYHIVGFAGFQLTLCDGAKHIEGVWRRVIVDGPTTDTPGFAGAALAVQLIK
jgi:Putative Flp pilus-assembly TadE/G-like